MASKAVKKSPTSSGDCGKWPIGCRSIARRLMI
jgi:hypothetical protein